MNDGATIREYGEPIDPKEILDPHDPDTLQLEPGHPGQGDAAYVERRTELFGGPNALGASAGLYGALSGTFVAGGG